MVVAAMKAIEERTARVGEFAVVSEENKYDLVDTTENLAEDKKFRADLKMNCAAKSKEWEADQKN